MSVSCTKGAFIDQVSYIFQDCSTILFIHDFGDGGDLLKLHNQRGGFTLEEVLFYTCEMVIGLEFIHQHNICHRNICPRSILISGTGHCMISNFFDAVICSNNNEITGDVGSPQFKAPEVISDSYSKSCDIFSLGCTIYYLFYGESPIVTDPITEQISYKLLDRLNQVSPLDTVFDLSTQNAIEKSQNEDNSGDQLQETEFQDILIRGVCSKAADSRFNPTWSKREIFLFPNRLEIPAEQIVIPIDEIISVEKIKPKDTEAILIKTHSRDITFSFEMGFEQEQWYVDILKVWKNVTNLSKNAPKQISIRRSMKEEMKRQKKVAIAHSKIANGSVSSI
ncbi:Oidioi.mRNA.OKI2018_I69.PAR.g11961.t1.cds [Oikopleura dioica]|uniref:Oidioi.mRNA.OKI2018_I69.PAR.g11961.t1.cds n=1 Tax=Oikopleura dioica TaxID=34765 RepID=A0ABN7S3N7_OIKDI|nr:Oidioi.mRNA.OKI2018_I69.PAR.g11961.t1.cds [Oikopleura dioica]